MQILFHDATLGFAVQWGCRENFKWFKICGGCMFKKVFMMHQPVVVLLLQFL